MSCSTDHEIRIIIYSDDTTNTYQQSHPWVSLDSWWHDEQTHLIKALCINLVLSYCFLFILFSNLCPWVMMQGHQWSLCVFFVCSHSADCSLMKRSSIKAWPQGQGQSPDSDSLPDTGRSSLINPALQCMKWKAFRNVFISKQNMSHCVADFLSLLIMFWMSCCISVHQYLAAAMQSLLYINIFVEEVCILHPLREWQSN